MNLGVFVFSLLLLIPASLNEEYPPDSKKIRVLTTAYYKPVKSQKKFFTGSFEKEVEINGKGKTYSGKTARVGFAAADLRVFPLGTILKVPGYGVVVIEDVGGAIKGYRLDLFMGNGDLGLKRAIEWGKREIVVEVLKWGDA